MSEKNPAAVALGRAGGLKGGPARAKKLSAKQRAAIARKAALARWANQEVEDKEKWLWQTANWIQDSNTHGMHPSDRRLYRQGVDAALKYILEQFKEPTK